MQRLKAFSFLCLFLFSTVMTYASVHHCSGEVTDVAVLTIAACDHEKEIVEAEEEEQHCHMTCCDQTSDEKEQEDEGDECCGEEDDACCNTEELSTAKNLVTSAIAADFQLISKILPSFYDFYFESHRVLKRTYGIAYVAPVMTRDVVVEVQSFLI